MKIKRFIMTGFLTAALMVPGYARAGDSSVITTYYWNNGWVEHASWDASFLGPDLRVSFDAWNWQPEFSGFEVAYDNIYMFGEIDLPQGLVDDFNDGVISQIWQGGGGTCHQGAGAAACEANGVISIDIEPGQAWPGQNRVASISTENLVVHGEFDVRIDFSLNPEFHSTPNSNLKLILSDGTNHFPEISVRTGYYQSHEVGPDYNVIIAETPTDHLEGRLRITRRAAGAIFGDGFESGDLSAWSSADFSSSAPSRG